MVTSALLAITLGMPAPIDYETKAKRIPVVLQELAKQTGQKLEADSAFTNEVVVLRAEDQELQSILDRIADVSVGKWERQEGRLVLRPDNAKRKQEADERMQVRIAKVQKHLDYFKAELDPTYDLAFIQLGVSLYQNAKDNLANSYRAQRFNPYSRLIMRSLLGIGAERLAKVEANERLVVSSKPTKMQLSIPDLEKNMALFQKEFELFETAKAAFPQGVTLATINSPRPRDFGRDGVHPPDALEAFMFIVGDLVESSPIVRMKIMRTTGDSEGFSILGSGTGEPLDWSTTENDDVIPTDPDSIALGKLMEESGNGDDAVVDPQSSLGKALRDPLKTDPLWFGSEAYLHYAKAKGKNFAMLVNDGAFGRFTNEKITNKIFGMFFKHTTVRRDEGNWILLTPSAPVDARLYRDDRRAIAALVNVKVADMLARGTYLLQRPWSKPDGVGAQVGGLVHPDISLNSFRLEHGVQRLYAALTSAQRERGQIPIGSLNADQMKVLNAHVFHSEHRFVNTDQAYLSKLGDSTHDFPNGLTANHVLQLADKKAPAVLVQFRTTQGVYRTAMDMQYVAMEEFWEKNPQHVKGATRAYKAPLIIPTLNQHVQFTIPSAFDKSWMTEAKGDRALGKAGTAAQLPAEHQKLLQVHRDQIQKWVEQGIPPTKDLTSSSGGVRGTPPP